MSHECLKCGSTNAPLPLNHLYSRCPICCELIAYDFYPVMEMPPLPSNRLLVRETGRMGGSTRMANRKAAKHE